MICSEYNIIIRVDATAEMGAGHFMRCMALAQWCQEERLKILFVYSELLPIANKFLIENQFDSEEIEKFDSLVEDAMQVQKIALKYHATLVVIDGYHFTNQYFNKLRHQKFKIIKIDDFGNDVDYVDIVINQNPWSKKIHYPDNIKCFLGLEYLLLKKEYWSFFKNSKTNRGEKKRVLVSLGGSDVIGVLEKVVKSIDCDLKHEALDIDVLLPCQYDAMPEWEKDLVTSKHSYTWLKDIVNMSGLLNHIDIAICAAGSICWELAFMKIPMVVLVQAENQKAVAKSIEFMGLGVILSHDEPISTANQGFQLQGNFKMLGQWTDKQSFENLHIAEKTKSIVKCLV
tara:strand:- start:41699 stop:42727 length:1029 start_codon:yes stop_codon:yes gene_type:complete